MSTMTYKDYTARIEYSEEDACFVGHIAGIQHIIGFHGETVVKLKKAFHEAVNFYLKSCENEGISPQRPYSGKIMLRVPPELHAKLAMQAAANKKSLNQWATDILVNAER